jgi:hypothetical protein
VDDISDPKRACVDDMDLDILKETIKATEMFHVSAKTGYNVKQSMELLEKIVSTTRNYYLFDFFSYFGYHIKHILEILLMN